MLVNEIVNRLKRSEQKRREASLLKEEIRRLPLTERRSILAQLRSEKTRSDNSNIQDVINDIINDLERGN